MNHLNEHDVGFEHGELTVPDRLASRLRWAVVASLVINMLLWRAASGIARRQVYHNLQPVEITRVVIDKKGRRIVKVIPKKAIERKVAQLRRRPEPRPIIRRPEPRQVENRPQPARRSAAPPQGAHNRVLTTRSDVPARPNDQTALTGGNAGLGKAIDQQNAGNARENPPQPVKPEPVKPAPPPPPPAPPVKVADVPVAPKPAPAPAPAPPPPAPPPPPPPAPKGPTKDAEAVETAQPEIPDDLRHTQFKSFVRVKVEVESDGSFTPILRTSSGNDEIDRRVLDALKRWRWKPALRDGEPVRSVQLFKFEFEVQ